MIDDIETLLALRIVGAADVCEADKAAGLVIAQEGQDLHDLGSLRLDCEFPVGHRRAGHGASKFRGDEFAKLFECLSHAQRSIVPVRRIFFCNCRMPYTKASAVGGQPGT